MMLDDRSRVRRRLGALCFSALAWMAAGGAARAQTPPSSEDTTKAAVKQREKGDTIQRIHLAVTGSGGAGLDEPVQRGALDGDATGVVRDPA